MRSRGDLIEAYTTVTGKESIQWERFFELAPSKRVTLLGANSKNFSHIYKLFKKRKGT